MRLSLLSAATRLSAFLRVFEEVGVELNESTPISFRVACIKDMGVWPFFRGCREKTTLISRSLWY